MKTRDKYIVGGVAVAALLAAPFIARAIAKGQLVTVTPNGPLDGGTFGPHTPGTLTSGIQEALDTGANMQIMAAPTTGTVYPSTMPLTLKTSNQKIKQDPLATIQETQQIDGGVVQVVSSGLTNISWSGGVWDANNLSMMILWLAKKVPGAVFSDIEGKNFRGIYGLSTVQNPSGFLGNAGGGLQLLRVSMHDGSAPSYTGGNGALYWLTGDLGISQPENAVLKDCLGYNTLNVAAGELIDGVKYDTNTIGLTSDHVILHDLSGEGWNFLAGGTSPIYGPNKSDNHVIKNGSSVTNARRGVFMNSNNGGEILNTLIDSLTVSSCRQYGIYEALGTDFCTFRNNVVPQGRFVEPGAGLHDVLSGNVGF